MKIKSESFGKLSDGRSTDLIVIENDNGVVCKITNYGGILTSWIVPDKNGKKRDIILGWDNVKGFEEDSSYLGALIGRYGNRIANGKFTLDGVEYNLAKNQAPNHLHGGVTGFNKVLWNYSLIDEPGTKGVKLSYDSKHMEEGYPGNLKVVVTYTLTNDNELKIDYEATTDKKTIVNLTSHGYFNLNGGTGNVLNHQLLIKADHYTPVDSGLIPTGEIKAVKGTDFDFTVPTEIGKRIKKIDIDGYDHNFVLNKKEGVLEKVADVFDAESGLVMELSTTEPGVQLYTAIHFDGSMTGKSNIKYQQYYAYCLETQHFPDSPNQPDFPSTILNPGEKYLQTTIYKVFTKQK